VTSRPLHDWLIGGAVMAIAAAAAFLDAAPAWLTVLLAVLAVANVAVPAVLRRRLAAREREVAP
jgi:ribose 1,5-bisphosphokinase PhnN